MGTPELGTEGARRPQNPRADDGPDVARVDSAIEQAARRGDFDNLPGAGKPLNLPATHDPDWWINQGRFVSVRPARDRG